MQFDRQSGVFCHVTSLPGPHGIGDLGDGARAFIDFLDQADQVLWQFCPLGPTTPAHGNSPYQTFSAFAGNPLLISLENLVERGYLTQSEVTPDEPFDEGAVEYDRVASFTYDRLRRAYDTFEAEASKSDHEALSAFREREAHWLEDYTLFRALKSEFDDVIWTDWPEDLKTRQPEALERYREELVDERRYRAFVQWLFDEQWQALREYANERGVKLVGDLPIYVALDSADVWASPDVFDLTEDNEPAAVAGVPPNPGDDGQRWGNPVYDWDTLRANGFQWWLDRLERLFAQVDITRIDHFKGFDEFWAIPADSENPADGEWRPGPGAEFFDTVRDRLGELPFFVEDLGFLDEGVRSLRDRYDFPGMRVPQYADWCAGSHMYQPSQYPRQTVAYTSTHDTDTLVGYYESLPENERECLDNKVGSGPDGIHWSIIEAVWNSEAAVAMTTVQDLHGLGSEARFNVPGSAMGNWAWRLTEDLLDSSVADHLSMVTDYTIR